MKAISQEQIDALLAPKTVGRRNHHTDPSVVPQCNHEFIPDKTLVTGINFKEFPTKRCTICNVWLLGEAPGAIQEVIENAGDWLA
jgi:hypothetical protein